MQIIKEDIKKNEYKSVYLLYGSEDYLKKLYRNKLKAAMLGGSDEMNYNYYEGKGIDVSQVIGIAETLPFFSDRRVIVLENTGFFKAQSDLADYIKTMPDTTHMVFVESEVDKRNRLYKAVKEVGYISEMNGMDEKNLKLWILSILNRSGKKITESTMLYFLGKTGSDMDNINNELNKLIAYVGDRDVVTANDVDEICTTTLTSKIFNMIDAIASKKQNVALDLYYDLLALKEKPMSILFLISRHFNILLQVKDLVRLGYNNSVIAKKVGVPPFAITKYAAQSRNFSNAMLIDALSMCVDIEEQVKTGRMIDKMGVELLIVKYSQK
ncbi:DNA polymerase III delta subunit [Lachnospiraceae bacterium KM106-2]|nr:DNA polymerase III delta subunit [Lachnospiraceae bacterium KM106-2]